MKKFLLILSIVVIASCASAPDAATVAELLELHNIERRIIGLADVSWSPTIAQSAQSWANNLASTNSFKHSGTKGVGENIAKGSIRKNMISFLFGMWAKEKENFDNSKPYPDCTNGKGKIGHYTQIIWSKTNEIGCGVANTSSSTVLVCQYKVSGNFIGNWVYTEEDIVQKPTQPGEPTEPTPVEPTEPESPTEEQPKPVEPKPEEPKPEEPKPEEPKSPTEEEPKPEKTIPEESNEFESPIEEEVTSPENELVEKLLALHNAERKQVGVEELTWSEELEESAQKWADYLAKRSRVSSSGQRGVGENIAQESVRKNEDMVEYLFKTWSSQKNRFNPNKKYPYCTTSGSVSRVSKYTQIIWSKTTEVGCGIAGTPRTSILVCHYKEKGNRNGYYVYPVSRYQRSG